MHDFKLFAPPLPPSFPSPAQKVISSRQICIIMGKQTRWLSWETNQCEFCPGVIADARKVSCFQFHDQAADNKNKNMIPNSKPAPDWRVLNWLIAALLNNKK